MPIYEYRCKVCERDFEYQQRMSDPEKDTCEACGGSLERLISRTAFQLKGSGWYKDLYSSKPAEKSGEAKPAESGAKSDAPAKDSGGSKSDTSSPSTPSTPSTPS